MADIGYINPASSPIIKALEQALVDARDGKLLFLFIVGAIQGEDKGVKLTGSYSGDVRYMLPVGGKVEQEKIAMFMDLYALSNLLGKEPEPEA